MQTITEFIRKHQIKAEVKFLGYRTEHRGQNWEHNAYTVTLLRPGAKMTTPFVAGTGISKVIAEDVLGSMASDTGGVRNSSGFYDWASEYGMDVDDPDFKEEAQKLYRDIQEQAKTLGAFLGEEALDELLSETEPY